MAAIANFGGEIEPFDMDADMSSLAARWLEWKSSAIYMILAKGITSPTQKEATLLHTAGRKLQKVYETLPEPTGLPEDANAYDKAVAKLDRYFADQQLWEQLKRNGVTCKSQRDSKTLKSYATVSKVEVVEKFWCKVKLGEKSMANVEFLVIKGNGRPILGRKTAMQLGVLEIKLPEVNLVEDEFQELFSGKVGKLTNYQVELHVKPDAKFVAQPCRRVPYSLRGKLEDKLQELEEMDIMKEWKTEDGKDFDDTMNYVNFIAVKAVPKAMKADEIEQASLEDEEMGKLRECIQTGKWEGVGCSEYLAVANELCVVGGIVMRGTRMVIPKRLRTTVMTIGHEGHPGIVSMKQRLRTKVWWPKLEKDVEKFVKTCDGCQLVSRPDPPEPVTSTELPEGPWRAVAIDFLGPLPT
ncbi:hypothetical protein QZH41_008140, partial [Actinostola sp. cb2023]